MSVPPYGASRAATPDCGGMHMDWIGKTENRACSVSLTQKK